jgi:hypothetical protein
MWWHNTDGKARRNLVNNNDYLLNDNACSPAASQTEEHRQSSLTYWF